MRSSSCSGVRGPMITARHGRMGADKGAGKVRDGHARLGGELCEGLESLQFGLVARHGEVEGPGAWAGRAVADCRFCTPRHPAAGERPVGEHTHVVGLGERENIGLDRPREDRVAGLLGAKVPVTTRS